MSGSIKVTPQRLKDASTKINNYTTEYSNKYKRMEEITGFLSTVWTGEANRDFTNKINSFMPDFRKLEKDLRAYQEFLMSAHDIYSKTETSIKDNANRVVTRG